MWKRYLLAHHYVGWLSILVGISFWTERYTYNLLSPATSGPAALMQWAVPWIPFVDRPLQIWGILFFVGGVLIFFSPRPLFRAIFLVGGTVTWAIFAASSLYESLIGPRSEETGSLVGVLLSAVVLLCFSSIQRVRGDFYTWSRQLRYWSGRVPE